MLSENPLHLIDIHGFVKLLPDAGLLLAGNPDFEFGIQVKSTRSLHTESGNAFVADRDVLCLAARDALHID